VNARGSAYRCEAAAGDGLGGSYDEAVTVRSMVRGRMAGLAHYAGLYRMGPHPFGVIDRAKFLNRHRISIVIDGGANEGQYASGLRSVGYQGRIISLEPSSSACEVLKRKASHDSEWRVCQLGLGDQDGEAVFNLANATVCNSFLTMGDDFRAEVPGVSMVSQETVSVRRLDTVARDVLTADDQVWVKLDVEGFEMPVLRGAPDTLARTRVLEVELATAALYEGEPLFFEVAQSIYKFGFRLQAVASAYQSPDGRTLRFDGLFDRPVNP
jgi:FkbM family methyltransferase